VYARELLGTWPFLFAAGDPLWKLCQRLFQEWYVGTEKLGGEVGRQGPKRQKRGLIHDESPIIPVGRIRSALSELTDAGLRLCVATGRPRRELLSPLERWGLLEFFDPKHVATYDDVQQAETLAGREGACIRLSKPHPFLILRAVLASADPLELARGSVSIEGARSVCVVGDSVADVVAASSVGCLSMGVLTGVDGVRGRSTLERAGVNLVADDVGMVPGVLRGVGLL
jgi:phosphoglycolate phosphatase-like HAD superfamily hydrolase